MEELQKLEQRIVSGDKSALLEYLKLQKELFYEDHFRMVKELKN